MKKNDIIELKIESLTNEGCGLGRYEGMVVFVPMSAAGDLLRVRLLKVNKSHSYGKIEEILSPSPDRIESDCPVFGKCGGCSFRHISYEAELRAKEGFVRDAFTRIGGLSPDFLPIIGNASPDGYRNKAQYPVGKNADGEYISGFYADRSHRIIPCESCRLEQAVFSEIRTFILEYCRKKKIAVYNEEEHKGVLRHICIRRGHYSGEINVTVVVRRSVPELKGLAKELSARFPAIKGITANINKEKTNVIYGDEEADLFGERTITDTMLGKCFSISPKSFYQVNTPMAEKLYALAGSLAEPEGKNIID